MDNSFIISGLSSLNFQVIINNKARFMVFLINILNVQAFIIASKSKLPNFFFLGSFLEVTKHSIKQLVLSLSQIKILEVYIYTFSFDRVKSGISSVTFKDKNSILM